MNQSLCLVLVLGCLISTQFVSARHHNRRKSTRGDKIVGGYNTTIDKVPYQAYLLLQKGNDYYQCGGSVINSKFILTAAHCLQGIEKAFIRVGSTDANNGGQTYESTQLMYHPMYNAANSDFDAGLIKVADGIDFNDDVKSIKLPRRGSDVAVDEELLVTGWGTTSENGNVSNTLMAVTVPVVSQRQCKKDYDGRITSRMFCAGVTDGGKDSCQGDSGGPAVSEDLNEQLGIVSFGVGCARKGYPGVYTKIADRGVRMWIEMVSGS